MLEVVREGVAQAESVVFRFAWVGACALKVRSTATPLGLPWLKACGCWMQGWDGNLSRVS